MNSLIKTVASRTMLAAVFVLGLAATVAAAPQRGGGGGHFGGGHMGGGFGGHMGGPVGGPRGHFDGGPRGHFDGGPRGHFHGGPRVVVRGGFFDPFWGPYSPYWDYPYWGYGYPYGLYDDGYPTGNVKTDVTPKQASVYVDGYYAGVADDFDGAFHRLHTMPGGHTVTLYLDGYRTVNQNIYVRPDSTYKLNETMEKLAPGEVSQPVPLPKLPVNTSKDASGAPAAPDGGSMPQR